MTFYKSLKEFLRNRDIFGHQVMLNFNRKGESHNTEFGGFVSVICKTIYLMYFIYLMKKMVSYGDDNTVVFKYLMSEDEA